MSQERLSTLLRQRALLSQHLAWLDTEIASANGEIVPAPTTPADTLQTAIPVNSADVFSVPTKSPLPSVTPNPPLSLAEDDPVSLANKKADQIIASYSMADRFDPSATKRGCIALAVGAGLILVGIFAVWYFVHYRR